MNFLPLIEAKRDGQTLNELQIQAAVAAFTRGEIPDYQMAAFLMAVYFRGLDQSETRALTLGMQNSGATLQFPDDARPLVDKHSTGGVGDKVSLPLAPLLACLGFRVPMISGRGLGITGGTLDKLESIPDFQTQISPERMVQQVQEIGCCICGQTATMTPADRALYALRDVTGTVPSIPLIVASILSKKLAENLDCLILDVKFGTAAFMQTYEQARELAQAMVNLGNECGTKTRAILTRMDAPWGRACGNWLEVKESIQLLEGSGPDDLRELIIECAAHLLQQSGLETDLSAARERAATCLASGTPRRKWDEMLEWQSTDLEVFNAKMQNHAAPVIHEIKAPHGGLITRCDARIIGEVIRDLGGGRLTKDSILNYDVGIDELAKPGEQVQPNDVLCRLHAANQSDAEAATARLQAAFTIEDHAPDLPSNIVEVVE
jgi:pyrimidine-nucleoside phosphorylase